MSASGSLSYHPYFFDYEGAVFIFEDRAKKDNLIHLEASFDNESAHYHIEFRSSVVLLMARDINHFVHSHLSVIPICLRRLHGWGLVSGKSRELRERGSAGHF